MDRYSLKGEKTSNDIMARASAAWATDQAHAHRLYGYMTKGWLVMSTPMLSNAPIREFFQHPWDVNMRSTKSWRESTQRGLPISCFVGVVEDSREGIFEHVTRSGFASSVGGGLGSCYSWLRGAGQSTSRGSASTGIIPFMGVEQATILAMSQGSSRRGSVAYWLDISHPEINEFLSIRREHGGDPSRKLLHSHHGVVINDTFLQAVAADADWDLIDPHTNEVTSTEKARDLWFKLLDVRKETGEPQVMNADRVDDGVLGLGFASALDYKVVQSNLCAEILLETHESKGNVCAISSVNALYFDDWKDDEQFLADVVEMIDNAIEYFIEYAPPELSSIIAGAAEDRPIGIGVIGFFSYLQDKLIAASSLEAVVFTRKLHTHIKSGTHAASEELAKLRGNPPTCMQNGIARRNVTLTAIAPNASSAIYAGVSPSIEPYSANIYTQKTLSGDLVIKNRVLDRYLHKYFEHSDDTAAAVAEVWEEIKAADGSVQDLSILSPHVKEVFRTAFEMDQMVLVDLQEHRQGMVDQGTSFNLFFPAVVDWETYNAVHWRAAKNLKTMYYLRSTAAARTFNTTTGQSCLLCE